MRSWNDLDRRERAVIYLCYGVVVAGALMLLSGVANLESAVERGSLSLVPTAGSVLLAAGLLVTTVVKSRIYGRPLRDRWPVGVYAAGFLLVATHYVVGVLPAVGAAFGVWVVMALLDSEDVV